MPGQRKNLFELINISAKKSFMRNYIWSKRTKIEVKCRNLWLKSTFWRKTEPSIFWKQKWNCFFSETKSVSMSIQKHKKIGKSPISFSTEILVFGQKKFGLFFPKWLIGKFENFCRQSGFGFCFSQCCCFFFAAVKMQETNVMSRSWRPFPQKRCPFGYLVPLSKFNFIFMSSRWEVLLCSQLFCLGTMWLTISLIVLTIVANLHIFGKKIHSWSEIKILSMWK